MKNNKVIEAGIGYIIGNYLIKGLTFFSIPIFTRILTPSDYGVYNTFLAYESIIYILIGFALHGSFKNAKYKYDIENYNSYISNVVELIILHTTFWLIITNILGVTKISIFRDNIFILNCIVLYSFSMEIIIVYNSYLSLEYKYKKYIIIAGINALGNILLSMLLIQTFFDKERYIGRIIGTVLPALCISIYICYKLIGKNICRLDKTKIKWGLKYSLPIVPHGISQVILNQFDRIMINTFINSTATGIYSFAYNLFSVLSVTTTSIDTVWTPYFYEKMNEKNYGTIKKSSTLYIELIMILCILVMAISPELIKILGTDEFYEAVYSVAPIVTGGFFSFIYTLPSGVEYYYSKTKYIAMGTIIAGIINIILNLFFIKKFGYIAAAYTTMISYILYFIFHYGIAKKINKSELFDTKIIILCSIIIIIFNFIELFLINNIIWRVGLGTSIALFFLKKETNTLKERLLNERIKQK
ncbi:MAG: oligosaccharide flippase family protein [Clostridia bacterium]|nr:oligosaccharide flippase family protein [Clostridia bacterium]